MGYQQLNFPENSVFLITGGAGFIGSNLCEAILNMGYYVRCFDNLSTGSLTNILPFLNKERFCFHLGDIRDIKKCTDACKGVDYVLHEAAWGSVPRSIEKPLLYNEINITGTLNMMEAASKAKVKKFVYASSSSVYGDSPLLPKVETNIGNVLSPYALTKKVCEEYGRLYASLYHLETIGLRYFNVFGRRQNPNDQYAAVIPIFIKKLIHNEAPIIYGDGLQSRDFTYIDNVIEANLKACLANTAGEIFNVAYGDREYLLDIYHSICKVLNKEISPEFCPDRFGDIKHSHADITKARRLLGYSPEYSFEKGLELAIDWYKKNL